MNILHVCPYFLPSIGGIETFVYNVSKELLIRNQKVSIICFSKEHMSSFERIDGIDVYRIKPLVTISSQQIAIFLKSRISKLIRSINPDIIHFHYPNPLLANALIFAMKKNNFNGKFFLHWHGDIVGRRLLKPWYQKSTNRLLKRADKISSDTFNYAAHSDFLKKYIDKVSVIPAIPNKMDLIEFGIDFVEEQFIKKEANNRIIVFSFGRFVKWKGFDYLIKAMNCLDENKYVLFLGGYGKYKKHLAKLSKTKNVYFVGTLNNSKKYTYLTMSDVFVFPSIGRQEAFGITLAEAMCVGKVPVLFDKPDLGAREIAIPNYTCICAEKIDPLSLANSIELFCSLNKEEKERIKSNIKNIVDEKLSNETLSKSITDFYFR